MSTKSETELATEKIARRLARENGCSDAMWELFLTAAYQEHFKLGASRPLGESPHHE